MAVVTWDAFKSIVQSDLPSCPWLSIRDALIASSIEFFERSKAWRTEPAATFTTVIGQSDYTPTLAGRIARINSVHPVTGRYLQKVRRGLIEPFDYRPSLSQGAPNTGEYRGAWFALQQFKIGDWVTNKINNREAIVFECVISGTSGSVEPTWTTNNLDLINDGSVTWRVEYVGIGSPREFLQKNDTTVTLLPAPDAVYTMAIDCCLVPDRDTATGIEDYLYQAYAEYIASGAIYRLAAKPLKKPWSNPDLAAYHKQNFENGVNQANTKDMQSVAPRARPRMF